MFLCNERIPIGLSVAILHHDTNYLVEFVLNKMEALLHAFMVSFLIDLVAQLIDFCSDLLRKTLQLVFNLVGRQVDFIELFAVRRYFNLHLVAHYFSFFNVLSVGVYAGGLDVRACMGILLSEIVQFLLLVLLLLDLIHYCLQFTHLALVSLVQVLQHLSQRLFQLEEMLTVFGGQL